MPRKRNWPLLALGALLLLFGLGCLNYTEANGLEHHREAAERFGLPPPSKIRRVPRGGWLPHHEHFLRLFKDLPPFLQPVRAEPIIVDARGQILGPKRDTVGSRRGCPIGQYCDPLSQQGK